MPDEFDLVQWSVRVSPRELELHELNSSSLGSGSTAIRTAVFLLWRDLIQLEQDLSLEVIRLVDYFLASDEKGSPSNEDLTMVNVRIPQDVVRMRDELAHRMGGTNSDVWRTATMYLHHSLNPNNQALKVLKMLRQLTSGSNAE